MKEKNNAMKLHRSIFEFFLLYRKATYIRYHGIEFECSAFFNDYHSFINAIPFSFSNRKDHCVSASFIICYAFAYLSVFTFIAFHSRTICVLRFKAIHFYLSIYRIFPFIAVLKCAIREKFFFSTICDAAPTRL